MCYMCVSPEEAHLPVEYILAARHMGNRDGAGVMYADGGRVCIAKVLGKEESEVRELYEAYQERSIAWHVRNQSMGPVTLENVHPYWVTNKDWGHQHDIALMHNGTVRGIQVDHTMSDSRNLATYFLRPAFEELPDAYMSDGFWHLVTALIGSNKLILLRDDGQFVIVNPGLGRILDPYGVWVSSDADLKVDKDDGRNVLPSSPPSVIFKETLTGGHWVAEGDDGKMYYRADFKPVTLENLTGKDRDDVRDLVRKLPDVATDLLMAAMENMNAQAVD